MNWSFQLYSARNFQPWNNVVKMLGELGYTPAEIARLRVDGMI